MSNKTPNTSIEQRLEELKDVPARNPQQAVRGRARFLNEAAEYRQAVSPWIKMRQSGWIFQIRKEKFAMNALVSLILAASLLLGGGATVAAAQDDLPNQSLYQLKLWTENAKMAMTGDPQEQATLLMTMAQARVQEMAALADMGITPPDQVRERLEQHLHQALQLAANMDEATRDQTLLQLRDCLQTQEQIMQQLQLHVNAETEPLFTRTRQMLQKQLHLVDEGLADPQGFQYMMNNQMQYGQDEEAVPEPNQQGEPGFHQNEESGKPADTPGNGSENGNGEGNEKPGGPNPDKPQDKNDGSGPGNEAPGGPNSDSPQGGSSGNGSGGGNK
jgi:hypothetical protein